MNKLIHTLFVLLLFSSQTHAALIEYNGYTLDPDTDIVTGGGLEWLQWDVTLGMSIDTALANIADGTINGNAYGTGWALASNLQMSSLFNAFGFGALFTWDSDEQSEQWTTSNDGAIEDLTTDPELQFIQLFGETESSALSPNPFSASNAFFGNDLDGDSYYNRTEVNDDFQSELGESSGNVWLRLDFTPSDLDFDNYGVALVRENIITRPVPEPSIIMLLAFGICGLLYPKRGRI